MKNSKDKFDSYCFPLQWSGLGRCLLFVSLFFSPVIWRGTGAMVFAQQLPFSSQYYTDPFVINPAYTGINENINVFVTHRSQWTGLAGAPQTSYFTIDGPVQAKNSSLGLKIYSDVTDIISRAGAFANYSYKFNFSDSNNLYVGIACGVLDNKIDFSKVLIKDSDDPFLSQQSQNKTIFSADLGVVYIWKKLVLGFAVPQVLGNRIKYPILNGDNGYYNLNRHYQGSIKYTFDVSKEKHITAFPLIMFRSVKGAPFQYDVNAVVDWKKTGWVGLTYHSNYAVAISGGLRYRNFCVGYAYDIGTSKIRSYTGSTSEFLLGYSFGQNKKEQDRFVQTEGAKADSLTAIAKKSDNQDLIAQIKAISDTNRAEINRLKAELEKAKTAEVNSPDNKGQNDGKGNAFIASRLVDEQGNPINDAQVEIVDKTTNLVFVRHRVTNDGFSRISVPSGKTVDLVFTKPGYLFKTINMVIPDSVGYEKDLRDVVMQKMEVGKKLVLNNIGFDLNQSTLRKESFSELDNSVKLMTDIPSLEMEISGHTDNIGSGKANQQLSEQRAKAVMDYLISKGCDKKRLSYKGYGTSQPIADNTTEEGRKTNRRTEFKVLKIDPEYTIVSGSKPSNVETIADNSMPPVFNAEKDALFAQMKAKSDINQAEIDQLKSELKKIKAFGTATSNAERVVDSLLYMNEERLVSAFTNENDSLRNQLKEKSDFNQRQIDQLKSELAKIKTGGTTPSYTTGDNADSVRSAFIAENKALRAQLEAKADTNQMQIDRLKAEFAKAKDAETAKTNLKKLNDNLLHASLSADNEALRLQLKTKTDSSQLQIDQLKAAFAKTKTIESKPNNTGKVIDSLQNAFSRENELLRSQLKAKSDTDFVQIDRLKTELADATASAKKSANAGKAVDSLLYLNQKSLVTALDKETATLRSQLKAKSDSNQVQLDQLKAEFAKIKESETISKNDLNSKNLVSNDEKNILLAKLYMKSDSNQLQINQLKSELLKTKYAEETKSKNAETANSNEKKLNDSLMQIAFNAKIADLQTQLKTKSDSNQVQIDQLKAELEKAKLAVTKTPPNTENDVLIAQLKVKSDTNQAQIDRLKAELEKAKLAVTKTPPNTENDILIAQLKVKSDTNQAQIDRLKAELEKAQLAVTKTPPNAENDILIAQLKVKSDTNQAQIDRLKAELGKAELGKAKMVGAKTPSATLYDDLVMTQLRTKSDSNQAQIDRLKVELAKSKLTGTKTPSNKENDLAMSKLKAKSDTNQVQIDQLKAELEKAKIAGATTPANTENDALIAQLKTKSDNYQIQIDQLKAELEKAKIAGATTPANTENDALIAQLKTKSDADQAEINRLKAEQGKPKTGETPVVNSGTSIPGVRTSKTSDFTDENGGNVSNGFYVVIGTFGSKENAERFKASNVMKGHGNTKMVQNQVTKVYNIFVLKTNNKGDADAERTKYKAEYPSVWILNLE